MLRRTSPLLLFVLLLIVVAGLMELGPPERTLGVNVRVVYLHGAWVWTALLGFAASALAGLIGLWRRGRWPQRSVAIGQAAAFFWVTYLPLSLWAMQTNWNGLFLQEPRWRVGLDFAIIALLLQGAILLFDRPRLAGALNAGFFAALAWTLSRTEQVMHPPSPIASSGSSSIRGFFALLVLACLLAAWQLVRWLEARAVA